MRLLKYMKSNKTTLAGLITASIAGLFAAGWISTEQATAAGLLAASFGLGLSKDTGSTTSASTPPPPSANPPKTPKP